MQRFALRVLLGLIGTLLTLFWVLPTTASADEALHYDQLAFPPLPEVQLPDYTRFELDNGLVAYLVEDHELPLVSGSATIRTGDRLEPADKTGLASVLGEVMRTGGSEAHPGDRLNQLLEQRAASIETGIDTSMGHASFSSLTADLDTVFALFAEVLREPAIPQDRIDLLKTQWSGSISRRNDEPSSITSREFRKLVYGEASPYARTVEYATLANIDRASLVQFHDQYFQPENVILGIVGDFDTAEMRDRIGQAFGAWQPSDQAITAPELPEVVQANAGGIFLVDQPQLTQSFIQIGHLGGRLDDPDFTALSVLNEIMNGFGGRLMNEVRSRQGLAYVVYGYWSAQFDYPGVFVGGGQTRSEATGDFIRSFLAEIDQVRQEPVSEDELARAKESALNSFIFNFQTPSQTLSRLINYEYYDYPEDFIFQYQRDLAETTAQQILEAAQRHIQPDRLVTLVVGSADSIQPALSALQPDGDITPIDITIPQS
ncbi:MAG: pitrilysin family protein [Cyanobacteria bacterium J06638_22]